MSIPPSLQGNVECMWVKMTIKVIHVDSFVVRNRLTYGDGRDGFPGTALLITGIGESTRGGGWSRVAIQHHRCDNIFQGINFEFKKIIRPGQIIELTHHHRTFSMELNFMRYCTVPLRYSSLIAFTYSIPMQNLSNQQLIESRSKFTCKKLLFPRHVKCPEREHLSIGMPC